MRLLTLFGSILLIASCSKDPPLLFVPDDPYSPPCLPGELVTNTHTIEGYTNKLSYAPGETVHFNIHSLNSFHSLTITRYGLDNEDIFTIDSISAIAQNYHCYDYSWGCKWDSTYSYTIPLTAKSGIYAARIEDGASAFYITFIVRNKPPVYADIVVVASTNTWQAYNIWGGGSFYGHNVEADVPLSQIVSFKRPNPRANPSVNTGHLTAAELYLHSWLDSTGYEFDVITDMDVHESTDLLENYKVVILNTHNEYWSYEMYNRLETFLANGGSLMNLSGNTLYWRVAFEESRIEVRHAGTNHSYEGGGPGGRWAVLRPEAKVIGVAYENSGYDTYAGYRVLNSSHWVFAGTGLANNDEFGQDGLNRGGASGHETDKINEHSPANLVHLAKGTNPDNGGADMIYYDHAGGGGVFSASSITYCGSLPVDSNVSRITSNVLDMFTQ